MFSEHSRMSSRPPEKGPFYKGIESSVPNQPSIVQGVLFGFQSRSTPYIWETAIPPFFVGNLSDGYTNPYGIRLMTIPYYLEIMPRPFKIDSTSISRSSEQAYKTYEP